ncbi:Cryptochrome-1 [Acropora cervicornis]|uniref:Cryptochrome-1 n=1 Tax=Acropora cervicornis TaxID=6130 RepID=A0AAD9UX65_ACRCE|nr:Cryptochrome-1 [Acropora cervicornis]
MATKTARVHNTIHWFRKGLRLHDNQSLMEACETSVTLRPVFFIDPDYVKHGNMGFNRWRFLIESLNDINDSLEKIGSRLFVVHGKPEIEFPKLFRKWEVTKLTFEFDHEPDGRARDSKITKLAAQNGIEVQTRICHSLYDLDEIIEKNDGRAPLAYKRLCSVVSSLGPPSKPIPTVDQETFKGCSTPASESDERDYHVPTLEELGIERPHQTSVIRFPGGETEALRRLNEHMEKEDWVNKFEKPNTSPNSLEPSTTVLSPYVMFGCLSARLFYHKLSEVYARARKHSQPPVSLHGQLLWREFFYTVAYGTPNFNKMKDNPVCLQVNWDKNEEFIHAWTEARTGYPFIDAIMTQLRREGWIHHLARHAVACFLTRGDLWISWEEGLKVFENLLLDHDWSLNAGNWLWLSASAFFHAYFRVYSPVAFGKKTDPNGQYIKKYLPALKKYPAKYIYEPWKAPLTVQQAAGCLIGKDYPKPIVDHTKVVKVNLAKMKDAREKQYGGSSEQGAKKDDKSSSLKRKIREKPPSPEKKMKKITDFLKG